MKIDFDNFEYKKIWYDELEKSRFYLKPLKSEIELRTWNPIRRLFFIRRILKIEIEILLGLPSSCILPWKSRSKSIQKIHENV